MITTNGLSELNAAMAAVVSRAVCTVSGKDINLPIHSTKVSGNKFQVNVYLDDTVAGTVTASKLYSNKGTLLVDRPDNIPKPSGKNLLVVFEFELSEVSP